MASLLTQQTHCTYTYKQALILKTKFTYFNVWMGNVLFLFRDKVSLCGPDWPETWSVDRASLELTEVHLLLLPKCPAKETAEGLDMGRGQWLVLGDRRGREKNRKEMRRTKSCHSESLCQVRL